MKKEDGFEHKLKRGFVRVDLEPDGDDWFINFAAEIDNDHPAEVVFEQVVTGFVDSEKSWVWPIKYECVPEPLPYPLTEGCVFRMTYTVPRWDDPEKTMPGETYSYRLARYAPDESIFEYQGIDHPMQGGGRFRAIPRDGGGSRFEWTGRYRSRGGDPRVVESLRRYLPVLYESFENNLLKGPPGG